MQSIEQGKVSSVANGRATREGSRRKFQADGSQERRDPMDREIRGLPTADPGSLLAGEADCASEVFVAEAQGHTGCFELAAQIEHDRAATGNASINRALANWHRVIVARGPSLPLIGAEMVIAEETLVYNGAERRSRQPARKPATVVAAAGRS